MMEVKKFILGALFGSFLVSFTAYAEDIIGKIVDGTFPVFIDGKQVSVDAITIEGTSYLPVRAVAESLGLDVQFTGREIMLEKPVQNTKTEANQTVEPGVHYIDGYPVIGGITPEIEEAIRKRLENEKNKPSPDPQMTKEEKIAWIDGLISSIKVQIEGYKKAVGLGIGEKTGIDYNQKIKELELQLQELQRQRAELEQQAP